jgi:hypothetical protein
MCRYRQCRSDRQRHRGRWNRARLRTLAPGTSTVDIGDGNRDRTVQQLDEG